jgi:ElaB/YqjD/DUF883 family membrane-anchored ribosome-binding protein
MNKADKDFLRNIATIATTENARQLKLASLSAHRERESIAKKGLQALSDAFNKAQDHADKRAQAAVKKVGDKIDDATKKVNNHTDKVVEEHSRIFEWYDHVIAIIIGIIAGFITHTLCVSSANAGNKNFLVQTAKLVSQKVGDAEVYTYEMVQNNFKIWALTIAIAIVIALLYYVIVALTSATRRR